MIFPWKGHCAENGAVLTQAWLPATPATALRRAGPHPPPSNTCPTRRGPPGAVGRSRAGRALCAQSASTDPGPSTTWAGTQGPRCSGLALCPRGSWCQKAGAQPSPALSAAGYPAQPHLQAVLACTELAVGPRGAAAVLHGLKPPREGEAAAPQGLGDAGAVHLGIHFAGLPEPALRVTPAHRPTAQCPQQGWACKFTQGKRRCRAWQGYARHSSAA